jgi:hypothetical protein
MSALGHKRTLTTTRAMSALPLKADISQTSRNVRFVPSSGMPIRSSDKTTCFSGAADRWSQRLNALFSGHASGRVKCRCA